MTTPNSVPRSNKSDWNDVLSEQGAGEVTRQVLEIDRPKPSDRVLSGNSKSMDKANPLLGTCDLEKLHRLIVDKAEKVIFKDLVDSYTYIGNHEQYYTKDGNLKIPLSVIAVLVNKYLVKLIDNMSLAISQLHSNDAEVKIAYLFNGKYWLQIPEGFIKNLLRDALIAMGYDPLQSQTAGLSELLVKTFWTIAPKSPVTNPKRVLINLQNTALEVMPDGTIAQHKHDKNDFMMYCLDYDYKPEAKCPQFMKYLYRVLPDEESRTILQELLGSMFTKLKLEKIGVLLGDGSNGKSVLLLVIAALLGKANMCEWSLKALTTDTNAANNRANLMGKLLNFAPEMNAKGEQAHDLIKAMASGESIMGKLLYKDTFTFTDYARLIFNTNRLPADVEHSHGFWRRWLIVVFGETISGAEVDTELHSKIISNELPGVLNWIIEGTQRLQQNKKFSPCKRSDEALADYKLDSDVVAMWLAERGYIPDETLTKTLTDLHRDLINFIIDGCYTKLTIKTLASRFRGLGYKQRKGKPAAIYITIK